MNLYKRLSNINKLCHFHDYQQFWPIFLPNFGRHSRTRISAFIEELNLTGLDGFHTYKTCYL